MCFAPQCILAIRSEDDCMFMQKLYAEHETLMYRVAYRIVKNQADADDVVSSALEKLIGKVDVLRAVEWQQCRTYVLSTVRNEALMLLRRRKTEQKSLANLFYENGAQLAEEAVDTTAVYRVALNEVVDEIRRLPSTEQDVLRMRFFDHMADSEIAQVCGVKPSTVRSRITRARQRLYKALRENSDDDTAMRSVQ